MTRDSRGGIRPGQPIAIVRLADLGRAHELSAALVEGGITALEYTLTNRHALGAIEEVGARMGERALVGAGTVLDAESARAAILSGAQFLVTPTVAPRVIACGHRYSIPVVCGAFTPTEILTAWEAGAELVKVFPAGRMGPGYIRDILGPLPQVKLVPTGGVNLDNCAAYLAAGAYTVGVGGNLVDAGMIARQDWPGLTELARRYRDACAAAA